MKITLYLALLTFIALCPQESRAQTSEPEQVFQLFINDTAYKISPNKELEVDLKGLSKIRLAPLANKNFNSAGVQFSYASQMAFEFEFDEESELNLWTLDGSNVVVMLFAYNSTTLSHKELAQGMSSSYEQAETYPDELKIAGSKLKGTKITVRLVGNLLVQRVFSVPSKTGSRILIVQDTLNDDGAHSEEYKQTIKTLDASFKSSLKWKVEY